MKRAQIPPNVLAKIAKQEGHRPRPAKAPTDPQTVPPHTTIVGIDPGTRFMGLGAIHAASGKCIHASVLVPPYGLERDLEARADWLLHSLDYWVRTGYESENNITRETTIYVIETPSTHGTFRGRGGGAGLLEYARMVQRVVQVVHDAVNFARVFEVSVDEWTGGVRKQQRAATFLMSHPDARPLLDACPNRYVLDAYDALELADWFRRRERIRQITELQRQNNA